MWVDLASPNVEASRKFYGQLFGWDSQVSPDPKAGGYAIFTQKGKQVAGLGPLQNPQQPPAWATYVATEDADATAKAVREAGGQVVAPPFDVLKSGRMAVFQDPTGAFISAWQPKEMKGADVVNEPVSFTWNELNTSDIGKVKSFYQKVFGWGSETIPAGQTGPPYTEWKLKGKSIAGGMAMLPPNVPPHWLVYFEVANADATIKKTGELGGKVMMGATDIPQGRFAILSDPHGAAFAIITSKR